MFSPPPIDVLLAIGVVIFVAIGIHEYFHAKLADMAGDPTPGMYGRVTLNLTKHFEPIGTLFIVITTLAGFGIGWGKPVPMDPRKMNNPKWDHFVAVLGGPVSNIVQAGIFAIVFRLTILVAPEALAVDFLANLLLFGVFINLALAAFNLMPIGPLDGMWLIGTFMRPETRMRWTRWNLQYGSMVFIGLILISQITGGGVLTILRAIVQPVARFFLGT
ncbi:MAG: site-2 protease family protein [Fimbriimonadaceae bacterium]